MRESKTLGLGDDTSMNAKRRISANDISNRSVLSKTFIVANTRHDCGISSTSASRQRARHAFGHEHERLTGAGVGPVIGQHDGLPGEDREKLAECAVEVRAVQLVDHEPLVRSDRLEEMPFFEVERVRPGRAEAADRLVGGPVRGRGGQDVAVALACVACGLGDGLREGGLGRPGGPVRITCLPLASAAKSCA